MPRRSPSPSSPTLAAKRMGQGGREVGVAEGGGEGEEGGEAGGVVAGSGAEDAGAVFAWGCSGWLAGKTVSRWAERRSDGSGSRVQGSEGMGGDAAEFGEGVAFGRRGGCW